MVVCDEHISRMGVFADNIEELILKDVRIEGQEGDALILDHIDRLDKD